jgi:uncharacterized protein (DUF983 family)
MENRNRPRIGEVLRRGLRRRCPRCGEGDLFRRGIRVHERCSECHLLYQPNYGDTWMFMIITDRIPILFGIAFVYFGFVANGWLGTAAFFVAVAAPMLATIRQRQGLALAIDYLVRVYLRETPAEIPAGSQYAS